MGSGGRHQPNAWSVAYVIGAYLVVLAVGVIVTAALTSSELNLRIGVLLVDACIVAALVVLQHLDRLSAGELGLRRAAPALSVALVVGGLIVVGIVTAVWSEDILQQHAERSSTLHESVTVAVLGGLVAGILAPVIEEVFFRGRLFGTLRRHMGIVWSVVLSSVLFAVAHTTSYPLESLPLPFVFGVVACVLYQRTGSLLPGIALHSLINASAFEKAVMGNDRVVFPIYLTLGALFLIYAGLQRMRRFKARSVISPAGRAALSGRDSSQDWGG
jgi:uncharacterized protein